MRSQPFAITSCAFSHNATVVKGHEPVKQLSYTVTWTLLFIMYSGSRTHRHIGYQNVAQSLPVGVGYLGNVISEGESIQPRMKSPSLPSKAVRGFDVNGDGFKVRAFSFSLSLYFSLPLPPSLPTSPSLPLSHPSSLSPYVPRPPPPPCIFLFLVRIKCD